MTTLLIEYPFQAQDDEDDVDEGGISQTESYDDEDEEEESSDRPPERNADGPATSFLFDRPNGPFTADASDETQ